MFNKKKKIESKTKSKTKSKTIKQEAAQHNPLERLVTITANKTGTKNVTVIR